MKRMPQPTVVLDYPFHGRWLARNSPARRVPSHGTHLFGTTYAIDFIGVDELGRSAARTWRTLFSVERPELFVGFGRPVLAPVRGRVVAVHDAEPDTRPAVAARPAAVRPAAAGTGQGRRRGDRRQRRGDRAGFGGPFVLLAHLQQGSVLVRPGDTVDSGNRIGSCGNSGNSTQPHVHVQVTDSLDWPRSQGLPMAFAATDGTVGLPAESEIVVVDHL